MTTTTTTAQWIAAGGASVGGVATAVAVVVTYLGLRGELRRANQDRAEAHREHRDREATQARLVLVRTDVDRAPRPDDFTITGTHACGEVAVLLDNQSAEPVLDARVEQLVLQTFVGPTAFDYAEPVQRWHLDPGWDPGDDPVPGGSGRNWHVIVSVGTPPQRHTITPEDRFMATLVFTDAHGRRWRRTGNDQPERVLPPGAASARDVAPGATASWAAPEPSRWTRLRWPRRR